MRMQVRSLALLSGLRIQCCQELWRRSQMHLRSCAVWLWCGLAAVDPIQALFQPLTWELRYATVVTLKSKQNKNKKTPGFFFARNPAITTHLCPFSITYVFAYILKFCPHLLSSSKISFSFFFFFFLSLRVVPAAYESLNRSCSCQPTPQPQQ